MRLRYLQKGKLFRKKGQEFNSKFKMIVTPFCFDRIERPKAQALTNGKWIQGNLTKWTKGLNGRNQKEM